MSFKMKTMKLQEMVSRSVKGAGNNRLIPLTSLMAVELKSGVLTLITTDATNYLYIKERDIEGEDFYAVVPVDVFSKLVSRLTCETVSVGVKNGALQVQGNGNYMIELPLDEEGNFIQYPDPYLELNMTEDHFKTQIHRSTIDSILNTIKPALATTLEIPCYANYYVGDSIVATDTYTIAHMAIRLFDRPRLISPELMNLLAVMTYEKVDAVMEDKILVFSSPDCVVYGIESEGIDDYSIDTIEDLVDTEFKSMCKVPRSTFLQVLDRLSLFVSTYDKHGINMTFTREGIEFSSKASSGVEVLPYAESSEFEPLFCTIDIEMLYHGIKSISADMIELYYGTDNAIKVKDGNISLVLALMDDEDSEVED